MTQRLWLYAVILALAVPGSAAAQNPRPGAAGPAPGILQNENQDQPIQIDAATLEVHDKHKMATFSGDVQVVQGDTTIKCQTLVVFYGAEHGASGNQSGNQAVASVAQPANAAQSAQPANTAQSAQPQPGAPPPPGGAVPQRAQDIRRIEARGGVTVISKDQNASGDLGVYDLKKKTITLTGNVVVSQGKNVLHGDRVVVDTTTGNAHFDSAGSATQNRVRALILPSKGANGGPSNIMSIGPPKPN
jgi:lipopolysaccharide export system protein LptA